MEDNSIIRVSNVLNLTKQEFSTLEKKIFACILLYLKEHQGINIDNKIEAVSISFPSSMIEETNLNRIDEALNKITSRKIKFNYKNDNLNVKFGNLPYFSYASYERKRGAQGIISIDINGRAKEVFLELANGYSQIDLQAILSLSSSYTIRMYELLSQYYTRNQSWTIEIDSLKELIGLDTTTYKNYGMFTKRILEYSQKELMEHCNIYFTWEVASKKGKKVTALTFHIQKIEQNQKIELSEEIKQTIDFVAKLSPMEIAHTYNLIISRYNLAQKQANYIFADKNRLNEFIRVDLIIEDMIAKGKPPKDRTKYLAKSLGLDKIKL